jgi:hypothetical protein
MRPSRPSHHPCRPQAQEIQDAEVRVHAEAQRTLAVKPRAANATIQAQNILLQKLGIAVDTDAVDADVVQKF